jgi:hypothetical protein
LPGARFANGAETAAYGYLFNYLSNVHKALTMSAGRDAGLSEKDALALSLAVKDADFVVGSQPPENAHWHSICAAGDSSSVCATKTGDFLMKSWNSKSLTGFAQFLHAVQDGFATGHQGKVWEGGIPDRQHIEGDLYPAGDKARQIIEQSSSMIRSYKSFCPQCFPT